MIKILFVCHGNICRSPMAESVCAYEVKKRGLAVETASAAAHTDEIGNPPHYGTREKLRSENIPLIPHRARLLTKRDGHDYDFILGMDDYNVRDICRIVGECKAQVCRLLDFSDRPRAIADPWYTGNFDETFSEITEGVDSLIKYLRKNGLV